MATSLNSTARIFPFPGYPREYSGSTTRTSNSLLKPDLSVSLLLSILSFKLCGKALRQVLHPVDVMDKILAFGVLGAILTMLIQGFVDFMFSVSPAFGTLFWTMLALLVVSARTVRPTPASA